MNHANKCKLTIIKSQKMIKSESKHKCHVKVLAIMRTLQYEKLK